MSPNRQHFIDELNALTNKIQTMGSEVIKAFDNLIKALSDNNIDLAKGIVENDKVINEIEVAINVEAYLLIARQCPVASDLRTIITALKIANDLERIADYAANISKYIIKSKNENYGYRAVITKLVNQVINMLVSILKAYQKQDMKLALEVCELDSTLDDLYKVKVKELISVGIKQTTIDSEEAIRALLILKQVERAGDHITNIAENIVYLINGKRVELN
ncbi:MAG: phosphate signaling complex protein PhoU [Candidatus Izemoplasma sp.]